MSAMPPPPPTSPPPGYVAYGGPGADAGTFQRIRGISKAMVVLLWIYLPFQLLSIFDLYRLSDKADKFLNGTITEQSFKDATEFSLGAGQAVMVVPIAVLTIIWMYRMASNLRSLDRVGQTWAPGWGIAGWFVPPCVIYVVPWLMFKELWKGSDPSCPPGDPTWKQREVSPLITVWWVLYGIVPIFSLTSNAQFVSQIRSDTTTRELAERYQDLTGITLVFVVLGMGATVVYLRIVRQLSARHMQATREA